MKIDFLASEKHFGDHMMPIWRALPPDHRGAFIVPSRLAPRFNDCSNVIQCDGCNSQAKLLRGGMSPVVVSAYRDLKTASEAGRQVVLCEHGAGQTYGQRHTSYAGGPGREACVLFLVPGPSPAEQNARFWPKIPCVQVGCPKLDEYHSAGLKPRNDPPVVAISFHWECQVKPETGSAWKFFRQALPGLAARTDIKLVGHGHPRMIDEIIPTYTSLGIPIVKRFSDVLDTADLFIIDNSSTMFEFASTGRPVVVMNPPTYRKRINYGLRFWECASVGVQVDRWQDLSNAVDRALDDSPEQRRLRNEAISKVYYACDGHAAERAAAAILSVAMDVQPVIEDPVEMIWLQACRNATGEYGRIKQDEVFLAGHRRHIDGAGRHHYTRLGNWTPEQHAKMLINRKIAVKIAMN